jgi:outer membrane protein OmpA-like peptidoglycan-associated protein
MKPVPKAILIGLVVAGIGYGVHKAMNAGYFNEKPTVASTVPDRIDLPTAAPATSNSTGTGASQIATSTVRSGETIRIKTIAWNATAGLHFANGGQSTTSGSLMDKRGVKVQLLREDDYSKMTADLAAFAKNPNSGVHFVIIMGDGYPAFYRGAMEALAPLGHSVEVIGSLGYSRGEDKCIIDAQAQPKGALIAGVLRDGDWNICVKYASDNGIAINPDEKTYDPAAMNFVAVDSFTQADEKFIAGACENRPVVINGKKTGENRKVCVNGTATWTPGDVKVAKERGNLRVLASTKEYLWQMPAVLIGNKQWMAQNPQVVENLLAAAFEGGEIVRSDERALLKAGEIQAKVYDEQDGHYWAKYHRGVVEADKTGKQVALGGSTTSGLGDNAYLFGLNGNDNLYKKVYNVFGNITKSYYPEIMPTLPAYEQAVNVSYLQSLLSKATTVARADTPTFNQQSRGEVFANRTYSIEFETGKATFTPVAVKQLNELLDNLAVSGLSVQVNGHTDNTGDTMINLDLSKKRAEAVKNFLITNAPSNFTNDRVAARGYGDTQPVADNRSSDGRARNRRVEVLLFTPK